MSASTASLRSRVLAIAAFALAMGWLEAVVVVYLRSRLGIPDGAGYPGWSEMIARFTAVPALLPLEQSREAATLAMLAGVGALAARSWRGRLGGFLLAFGLWDLAYYAALRLLVDWPTRLLEPDLLFLIPPTPLWVQPVALPMLASVAFVAGGVALLARDRG